MRKNGKLFITLLVVLGLFFTACGSSDSTDTTAGTSDTTAGSSNTTAGSSNTTMGTDTSEPVTLRVLAHANPPAQAWQEAFNAKFQEKYPNVTVDVSVVASGDLSVVTQTRLSANDIDVIDIPGFSNPVADYMSGATPPNWQTLIDAGLLLDLTDQPFVQNYDAATIADAMSYNDKIYQVNGGRVSYSGMFVNKDLLAAASLAIPTTWSELVSVCDTVKAAGNECMTVGGADGWPVFVGSYGLLGSFYPDQAGLVEGLWTGAVKWDDAKTAELWNRYYVYATDMLEPGVTSYSHDADPARYAAGDVAFMPTGVWQAPALEAAEPGFDWTYVPFPGSDNASDNQYLFGKYDQGWAINANSPNQQAALDYLAFFSDPANFQEWINAVGFLPTQPGVTLDTKLGGEVAPYLENYRVGFEQYWVQPTGAGQWANGSQGAAWFAPFNEWTDPAALSKQSQADLQAGLDAG